MADERNGVRRPARGLAGIPVGLTLGLLALWFVLGPNTSTLPEMRAFMVPESLLTTAPRRAVLGDPPVVSIAGYERTCMDCHKLFPARSNPPVPLLQHQHVVMDHGINDRCRNCHDLEDRDRLMLQTGITVPYGEAPRLCGNCHGPTYRDWERGMHGRTNGFWSGSRGEAHRLGCTECHDPHRPRSPAMDPLPPLPRPNTLRMDPGDGRGAGETEERDPLRQVLMRSGDRGPSKEVR